MHGRCHGVGHDGRLDGVNRARQGNGVSRRKGDEFRIATVAVDPHIAGKVLAKGLGTADTRPAAVAMEVEIRRDEFAEARLAYARTAAHHGSDHLVPRNAGQVAGLGAQVAPHAVENS